MHHKTSSTPVFEVDQLLAERDTILDELKFHLTRAQSKMKVATDLHRREVQFKEGDLVYLKIQQYR